MKIGLFIKITDLEDYEKANLYMYQSFVEMLIYLSCSTSLKNTYIIE